MEGRVVVTCSVVGLLGILSAAAGFAAEATRIKLSEVYDCALYPESPATALGLTGTLFVMAFVLLLVGAVINDQHAEENMYFGAGCYVVKPGVFAGGAILSLVSVILGIISYVTLTSAKTSNNPPAGNPNGGEMAIGQPQFPPQRSQQPV